MFHLPTYWVVWRQRRRWWRWWFATAGCTMQKKLWHKCKTEHNRGNIKNHKSNRTKPGTTTTRHLKAIKGWNKLWEWWGKKRIKLLRCSLQCVLYSDICENNHVNIESECVHVYMYIKMDASASFTHSTVYNTGTARGSCSLWKQYKLVVFLQAKLHFLVLPWRA